MREGSDAACWSAGVEISVVISVPLDGRLIIERISAGHTGVYGLTMAAK
ncbi:Uncharacterised protein [Mycobacteroides abscessus subsp. abscessus]|nr:Uncharacterised protein [Mycobacteroides abscessus subsp. abscessus]